MSPFSLKQTGKWFLIILLLVAVNKVRAQTGNNIVITKVLDGANGQLVNNAIVTAQYDDYFNASLRSKMDTPFPVRNIIAFKINEASRVYLPATFNAMVSLHITYTTPDLLEHTTDQDLAINYDTANAYTMRSSFVFANAQKVVVKVVSITTNASTNVLPALMLENTMELHPVYKWSCTDDAVMAFTNLNPPNTDSTDEIVVSWAPSTGADVYDLEWAYVDSSAIAVNRYGNPVNPALVFAYNTTRVTITGNSYAIPLLYDDGGVLFYRVRAVQEKGSNRRIETVWSSDFANGLGAFNFCGHQRSLNWQSSIAYAEDGKRKVTVQYFDGSLRSRQTVTKDNTTNTTIVAETAYDYQGRPAIQVLPAPTLANVIKYTRNLNRAINGAEYDKEQYDHINTPAEYLTTSAAPMDTTSGANSYYSAANPEKNDGINRYIPKAEGFAFTETQYTQDNTGRISKQSGVGATYKIGSNHETKYFYGTPAQEDLYALFGTEVGDVTHYFKNMVADANGQYAVTYVDMHGRTIATALAGSPENSSLSDVPDKEVMMVTDSLSGPNKNTVKNWVLESKQSQLVVQDDTLRFAYKLNPPVLKKDDCDDQHISYTGLYDLEIKITDDAYNQHLPGGHEYVIDTSNYSFDPAGNIVLNPIDLKFNLPVVKGNYEITKTLSVSRLGMNYYRDSLFLKTNVCTSLEEEIEKQRVAQRTQQCFPDCASCKANLASWDDFRVNYVVNAGNDISDTALYRNEAWAAYQAALDACKALCGELTEADDIRMAMLQDMTAPSGQYANPDSTGMYTIYYQATENAIPIYRRNDIVYLDEAGNPDLAYDASGMLVEPQQLLPTQFAEQFKPSWAAALLPFHPEYCKLTEYLKYDESNLWSRKMERIDTYAEAKAAGYLNPTGNAGFPFPVNDPDPLAATQKASLEAKLNQYIDRGTSQNPRYLSMWSVATISIKCPDNDNGTCANDYNTPAKAFDESRLCEGDLNMAWRTFRQLYLNAKRSIMETLIPQNCGPTESQLVQAWKSPRFNTTAGALAQSGLNIPMDNQSQVEAYSAQQLEKIIADNCKAYVEDWISKLAPCKYDTTLVRQQLVPLLLAVCKEGGDIDHTMGASTVKPGSTNQYKSFEEVLTAYNETHGHITDPWICNTEMLPIPKAYDKQTAYVDKQSFTRPDDCECNNLGNLQREYLALKRTEDANLSAYLLRTRNVNISQADLDILLNACSASGAGGCSWLPKAITIPVIIQCKVAPPCATCAEINNLYSAFTNAYPGITPLVGDVDTTQQMKNELFASYMNNHLGFSKQAWEYVVFMDSCEHAPPSEGGTVICRPGAPGSNQMVSSYNNGGTDIITDIHRTVDNGYILAGATTGCSKGGKDAYVIKTDSKGEVVWSKTYGAEQNDEFTRLVPTGDSGYIGIGTTYSYCYDQGAIMVVKLDTAGAVMWNKVIDFAAYGGKGTDVIQTRSGEFAFAGLRSTAGAYTDWVIGVLSDMGELNWMKQLNKTGNKTSINLLEDKGTYSNEDSNTLLLATTSYATQINYDAVVLALDRETGNVVNKMQYDLANNDNIAGNIVSTGSGYRLAIQNTPGGGAGSGLLLDVDLNLLPVKHAMIDDPSLLLPNTWTIFPAADQGVYAAGTVSGDPHDVYWHRLDANLNMQWSSHVRINADESLYRILANPDGTLAGAGVYNNAAMLMLATSTGKTGCNDTTVNITTQAPGVSILSFTLQTDSLLGSDRISNVVVEETVCHPTRNIVSCPGLDSCYTVSTGPLLCGNAAAVFQRIDPNSTSSCSDSTYFAVSAGTVIYNAYVDSVKNDFEDSYISLMLQANEQFAVTYGTSEYHYTLYYYDQAGNLVKTIPPAGVVKDRSDTWINQVRSAIAAGTDKLPAHRMATEYRYNTLNQAVAQKTPDAGKSRFWYDRLGRLVVSQNAKQLTANAYSYTLYDVLGRITEVGEVTKSTAMTDAISRDEESLSGWINGVASAKTQITRTVYDLPAATLDELDVLKAKNLRNRVAWSAVYGNGDSLLLNKYESGTFYSYDIHGNVDTLMQDYRSGIMADKGNEWKKIAYNYDLVSGKVNTVSYQAGKKDAFYHRYSYDAENRITNVETSNDSIYWENDAFYQYYKHGPLARAVIGQQQVQGLDYAYTLQGWLKGINGTTLTPGFDLGGDGAANGITARDAFGFALHYYGDNDYKSINSGVHPFASANSSGSNFKPLFNGNIGAMSVNLPKVGEPLFYSYGYDALNRIVSMDALRNLNAGTNTWAPVTAPDFAERVSYDPNGNILGYKRNGNTTWAGKPQQMDSLTYHYQTNTNQLRAISDSVGVDNYDEDIDNQRPNNYHYDAIGNLVRDTASHIKSIEWTVYGKISKITKDDNSTISYTYDVTGNRISKKAGNITTWYVRDATGNVMSVYVDGDNNVNGGILSQTEVHLYGSSRLGLSRRIIDMQDQASPGDISSGININFIRGNKFFELSNHLGNVLATVGDTKRQISANNSTVDSYEAKVTSAQDYYPFGMLQPGRKFSTGEYRYGFNGKENDNEVKGEGNSLDFGSRVYDPRLGRWLSVDPLQSKYPGEAPYVFSGNSPLLFNDPDGKEKVVTVYLKTNNGTYKILQVVDKKYFEATLDQGLTGIHGFNKHSVYQTITIDMSKGTKTPYQVDEQWTTSKTSFGQYLEIKADRALRKFNEPTVQPFGYVLSGNDNGGGYALDLVSDAVVKEHIDFGDVLDMSAAWRDITVGDGIGNLLDFTNTLKEAVGKDSKGLDMLLDVLEKVDSYMDGLDAANVDPSINAELIYLGDSADCPSCSARQDARHIDYFNGDGTFSWLRTEGKTDATKKNSNEKKHK
ncbi:RHS repeat-associated core domain-containing protein [Chitinophaga sp. GbtcB8]|uniref:RHS repeat-associated core domain-containing protein n=1 Tax=Chitinophaga sp. GbtcB8 TaxID=2824753 RepID=UPI001C2F5AB9|nr:RHS repeat-associated core domain-containing protein [Chitinophaga sp. GbtcB8]